MTPPFGTDETAGSDEDREFNRWAGESPDRPYQAKVVALHTTPLPTQRAEARTRTFGRLRILSVEDAYNAPPREYLLDGLIARKELSVWWGAPKCGKSFLMLRIAYCLAQGRSVWGREVTRCPVLYIAAEGESGVMGRIRALSETYGPAPDFHFIAQSANLFDPDADLGDIIDAVNFYGCGLNVVDTLARTMQGGDENKTSDMGVYIKNCDRLREETGTHVAAVHHGGWAGDHMRGSISLLGAADLSVKVSKEKDGSRRAHIENAKDDEDGYALAFTLEPFRLPDDAKGRPRFTRIAVEAETAPAEAQDRTDKVKSEAALTPEYHKALKVLRNAACQAEPAAPEPGHPKVQFVALKSFGIRLISEGWFDDDEIRQNVSQTDTGKHAITREGQNRMNKALYALEKKGLAVKQKDVVWPL